MTDNTTALSADAQLLQDQVATAKVIGVQAYWESRSGVTRQELRDAAQDAGVDIAMPDPNPEATFRATMSHVRVVDKALVARETRNDDVLVYAIVRVDPDDSTQVGDDAGEVVNRVLWRKVEMPNEPRYAFRVQDEVATQLAARYEHAQRYLTSDEARNAVSAVVKALGGIRLLGRMWFVNLQGYAGVLKVQSMLHALGMVCHLIPVLDLGDSRESMAMNAERQVWKDVRDLMAEVERWKTGARNPRKTTLADRVAAYRSLRDGVDMMADVLALKSDELRRELNDMEQVALAMLDPDAATPATDSGEPSDQARPQAPAMPPCCDENMRVGRPPCCPEGEAAAGLPQQPTTSPPPKPAPPVPPPPPGRPDGLDGLTIKELRKKAKAVGIRAGRLSKQAIIAALRELKTQG